MAEMASMWDGLPGRVSQVLTFPPEGTPFRADNIIGWLFLPHLAMRSF